MRSNTRSGDRQRQWRGNFRRSFALRFGIGPTPLSEVITQAILVVLRRLLGQLAVVQRGKTALSFGEAIVEHAAVREHDLSLASNDADLIEVKWK